MTLPDERTRAVQNAELFLFKLTDPRLTPRIPMAIRHEARSLLKHYPVGWELNMAAKAVPDVWGEPLEKSACERLNELRELMQKPRPKRRRPRGEGER